MQLYGVASLVNASSYWPVINSYYIPAPKFLSLGFQLPTSHHLLELYHWLFYKPSTLQTKSIISPPKALLFSLY